MSNAIKTPANNRTKPATLKGIELGEPVDIGTAPLATPCETSELAAAKGEAIVYLPFYDDARRVSVVAGRIFHDVSSSRVDVHNRHVNGRNFNRPYFFR